MVLRPESLSSFFIFYQSCKCPLYPIMQSPKMGFASGSKHDTVVQPGVETAHFHPVKNDWFWLAGEFPYPPFSKL